jgi:hypothetical protein
MSPEEAGQMLSERVIVTRGRGKRVRAAVAAGLAKHQMHLLTGLGQSTIDRILAATAIGRAINGHAVNGPSHGPSGGGDDH